MNQLTTVLEWGYVTIDESGSNGTLTRAKTDRLLAVAQASKLGGEDGVRILTDHHRRLRAQQVVGVIAADGATLEILPKIDFPGGGLETSAASIRQRLIHMLAVALDLEIDLGDVTRLGTQQDTLLEILIRVFSQKLIDAVRQGMPRQYLAQEEDLRTLRGRLNVRRQFTLLAASPERLACRFDALSPDIALNRIMKAAVSRLSRIARSADNQRRLRELAFAYSEIAPLPVAALRWDQVKLDRTNARWRDLISLAKLLLGERFQTTSAGETRGFSLLFEMNTLFEEYVARMLGRALAGTGRRVVRQGGRLYCLEDAGKKLFQTRPDILIKNGPVVEQVIDTKWKRVAERADDPKQGVSQADVYQMMAYGRLYQCPHLTLLYPHHAGLSGAAGRLASFTICGGSDRLETASVDVTLAQKPLLSKLAELCMPPNLAPSFAA